MPVAVSPSPVNGRHDPAMRRRSIRKGEPPPFYRVWGGTRGRYVVVLYREP